MPNPWKVQEVLDDLTAHIRRVLTGLVNCSGSSCAANPAHLLHHLPARSPSIILHQPGLQRSKAPTLHPHVFMIALRFAFCAYILHRY